MKFPEFIKRRSSRPVPESMTVSLRQRPLERVEDADEYAVYRTVLSARYCGEKLERFVIANETISLTDYL